MPRSKTGTIWTNIDRRQRLSDGLSLVGRQTDNLVFSSVGDKNRVNSWLQTDRSFDVCISFFGDGDFDNKKLVNFFYRHKGFKFANFLKCAEESLDLSNYEFILFVDDDIIISTRDIEQIFSQARRFGLHACQPSLSKKSCRSYKALVHRESVLVEYSNFVEIQCVCLSRHMLELCLPYLPLIYTGWGLDMILWELLGRPQDKVAILHSIQMTHPYRKEGRLRERAPDFEAKNEEVERKLAATLGVENDVLVKKEMIEKFGEIPCSPRARRGMTIGQSLSRLRRRRGEG